MTINENNGGQRAFSLKKCCWKQISNNIIRYHLKRIPRGILDEEVAVSLQKKDKSLEAILSFSFASTSKTFFGVKLSISRHHCLSTHHSTNTHNHHRNYSIIHHPLQAILFFCVIAPIFATLVKIFQWLMMCHR